MRIVIEVGRSTANDFIEQIPEISRKDLPDEEIVRLFAQDIIDRYLSLEYFDQKDIESMFEESV